MATERREIRVGARLPPLPLEAASRAEVVLAGATSRDALVLLLVPREPGGLTEYLNALGEAAADIEHWYARVLVVADGGLAAAATLRARLSPRLAIAAQADASVHETLGIDPANTAVLIADRYGQIYLVAEAAHGDELPDVRDIEEWTKFLATQCPECGVIDEPGYGEWSV